ncbi:hypothetical protein CHU98_g3251 [Xylaria longipes]|nr:hypothetical protein CHU98_g3251 [Xylaria longipes]
MFELVLRQDSWDYKSFYYRMRCPLNPLTNKLGQSRDSPPANNGPPSPFWNNSIPFYSQSPSGATRNPLLYSHVNTRQLLFQSCIQQPTTESMSTRLQATQATIEAPISISIVALIHARGPSSTVSDASLNRCASARADPTDAAAYSPKAESASSGPAHLESLFVAYLPMVVFPPRDDWVIDAIHPLLQGLPRLSRPVLDAEKP